jgi:hypothetical protein
MIMNAEFNATIGYTFMIERPFWIKTIEEA